MNFFGVLEIKLTEDLKLGDLNMTDFKCYFMSFKPVRLKILLNTDPEIHNWAQIAHVCHKPFLECNTNLLFNFDEKFDFPDMNHLRPFLLGCLVMFQQSICKF